MESSTFEPIVVSRGQDPTQGVKIWQGDVGGFEQDESGEIVFIITPPEIQQDDGVIQDIIRAGYDVEKLPEGNVYVVTSRVQNPGKFWIYHTPFVGSKDCTPSPSSDACYHLQYSFPYCGILWQKLARPPERSFAQTSSHFHEKQSEKWLVLSGEGVLLSRPQGHADALWQPTRMQQGKCYEVLPGTQHQLRTSSEFSTLLVMTGHPDGFSLSDHFYVEPPPMNMVIC